MMEERGVQRILEEYQRWQSFGYTHQECLEALKKRDARVNELASSQDIDRAITILEVRGDLGPYV